MQQPKPIINRPIGAIIGAVISLIGLILLWNPGAALVWVFLILASSALTRLSWLDWFDEWKLPSKIWGYGTILLAVLLLAYGIPQHVVYGTIAVVKGASILGYSLTKLRAAREHSASSGQ